MDTKKKITLRLLLLFALLTGVTSAWAQRVKAVEFCSYEYDSSGDDIVLRFNLLDERGEHIKSFDSEFLSEHLRILEDGHSIGCTSDDFVVLKDGIRIPDKTTIVVLVDRGIDSEGKREIKQALDDLINSAPDGCVYLSFFDERTTESRKVNSSNFRTLDDEFRKPAQGERLLYAALKEKLHEFNGDSNDDGGRTVGRRAKIEGSSKAMFLFVDGEDKIGDYDDYFSFTNDAGELKIKPTIYAFYYASDDNSINYDTNEVLYAITGHSGKMGFPLGKHVSTNRHQEIIDSIGEAIEAQKYDYALTYKAIKDAYSGKVEYSATWDDEAVGKTVVFNIGTPENPWPNREATTTDVMLKYGIALLALLFTLIFFFVVMKIVVPGIKSKLFAMKYYKRYEEEYGVQSRKCSYCMQTVEPGQMVVVKCKHLIHVRCWKENDYRCAEYGQNCNEGIQEHLDRHALFTKQSMRDCHQAFSGIIAGFVSWIVYELIGRGVFRSLAAGIANTFLTEEPQRTLLLPTCTSKVASFLAIGMLLGFLLSLVFRWNEEYRKKNATIYMKILGLSLLSSFIGLLAFAFGAIILCMMVSSIGTPDIPWYCSMPAYILFSVCASLSLTIKTSIPIKSAMLGGLCSAFIGFVVLYFTTGFSTSHPWMNMLLDFIIYGGGLGASLVTVRMLAEKYFLVIKNGPKAGTRIPIHKWMNATGGGNKVSIGIAGGCEVQMNWEKSNKVAKEHAVLYIDHAKSLPVIKPMATNVIFNSRAELPVRKVAPLSNGDTFKIGDTIFLYEETD